jgi:hypothetical protein
LRDAAAIPKLEVYRLANNTALGYPTDNRIVALETDATLESAFPLFQLDDYRGIANFIVRHVGLIGRG